MLKKLFCAVLLAFALAFIPNVYSDISAPSFVIPDSGTAGGLKLAPGGTAPTIGSFCGTSPSVAGNNNAMMITIGSGGVDTLCSVNFGGTWSAAPVCLAQSTSFADALGVSSTTTNVSINKVSAITAGAIIRVLCFGK